MGCLTAHISRQGQLSAKAMPVETPQIASKRVWSLGGVVYRLEELNATTARESALSASVAYVCAVGRSSYLRVTPQQTQWVTEYDTALYNVISNQKWIVELINQE